jgi:hypothetical protein
VLVAQWLLVFVEFYISPGYDPKHHGKLIDLENELRRAKGKLDAARPRQVATVPRASRLPPAADAAVRDYQKTVKDFKQDLVQSAAEARRIRDHYFRRHYQCADALEDQVIPFFRVLMDELVNVVRRPCLDAGIDPKLVREVNRPDLSELCVMDDDRTFTLISDFKPAIEFPEGEVIVDFEELYRSMQKQIRDKRNEEIRDVRRGDLRITSVPSLSPKPSAVEDNGTPPEVSASALREPRKWHEAREQD